MSHTWNPLAYPSSSTQRWSCRPACTGTWRQAGRAKLDEQAICAHHGAASQGSAVSFLSPASRKQVMRHYHVLLHCSKVSQQTSHAQASDNLRCYRLAPRLRIAQAVTCA